MMDIKERYESCEADLPSYKELNAEFDLDELPPETRRVCKEAAKRVFDRISGFKGILEGLLQPERFLEIQESSVLTEPQRTEISMLLRKLMRLDRIMLEAELLNTDAAYADYLRIAWAEWPALKEHIIPIVQRLQEEWRKPSAAKNVLNYLG